MAVTKRIIPISESELDALVGLPHICYSLYINLRALMDSESGHVGGAKRKVSWSGLCELLHVEQKQGRKDADSLNVRKLRHTVDTYLIPAGLVERKSISTQSHKQLILKLPKAITQKKSVSKFGSKSVTDELPQKACNNSTIGDDLQENFGSKCVRNFDTYKYNNNYYSPKGKSETQIDPGFSPSTDTLSQAEKINVIKHHSAIEVEKFISYYRAKGIRSFDWQAHYKSWLIRAEEFQNKNNRRAPYGSHPTARHSRAGSLIDDVKQQNEHLLNNIIDLDANDYQEASCTPVGDAHSSVRSSIYEQLRQGGE